MCMLNAASLYSIHNIYTHSPFASSTKKRNQISSTKQNSIISFEEFLFLLLPIPRFLLSSLLPLPRGLLFVGNSLLSSLFFKLCSLLLLSHFRCCTSNNISNSSSINNLHQLMICFLLIHLEWEAVVWDCSSLRQIPMVWA